MESERAKLSELQANHLVFSRELAAARSQEVSQKRELMNFQDELDSIKKKHTREIADLEVDLRKRDRKVQELEEDLRLSAQDLSRERNNSSILKATISEQSTTHVALKAQINALQAQLTAVQASSDSNSFTAAEYRLKWEDAERKVQQLEQDLQDAEMSRRRLHNMVQELKGNIRVFCRVRPVLPSELSVELWEAPKDPSEVTARIEYPDRLDHKEIVLNSTSESATGQERKETWQFTFDRVFEPHSTQSEVFEDISQLAQSCVDGYNVCIFAYGQTGSGKSFTMEGGLSESTKGMIPRAVEQVFQVAELMKKKGWEYKMEGQFLEIYNETINDLLGTGELDKKKHEIKHDKTSTRVTDVNVIPLHSSTQVQSLLSLAKSRRTVAATLMNERSSRSHSVFTLRISGKNPASGDTCEGSLNLVDLAGSERLEKSGAGNDKDRLKETQNINKSLSALGDVIAALGEKGDGKNDKHIPYRNSKLTYLLQHSLSGNSKTLMVLNLSPLFVHMNESLCSLRFATKVNNTNIGTAKKIIKASS
ncbi:kinesin-domain-containing protein [Thelephora ganbajun]|uniref:Kinesin-domain-containing protein n=1 Tax=Thelephora ganbajun TaxID=370292 RepID=A0ACB6Z3S0_THEGA|nr:kinesin-domain-containing protein [Thelephora ganbajun]